MILYKIDNDLKDALLKRLELFKLDIEGHICNKYQAYESYKKFLVLLELEPKEYEECIRFGIDFFNM